MRTLQHGISMAVVLCGVLVPTHAAAQARTPEQEVLAFMIARHSHNAVLNDSAWVSCPSAGACRPVDGVPADLWAEYVRATREPALLRDLLPADLDVLFQSEHVEDPSTPCSQRKNRLRLSRPGVSADGTAAVIWWSFVVSREHLGTCGGVGGGTLLLRKNALGVWEVERPLSMFVS